MAEYFARGSQQAQAGHVTIFKMKSEEFNKLAQRNFENRRDVFDINPNIGKPEQEYLFNTQIDSKYVVGQYQVATNRVEAGSLAARMVKIAARTPEEIANRTRIATLIQKARIQGDPGVPQLISKLEKNGVQVKDTNHLIGNPLREVDIETAAGIIVQVKKLSSAQKIIEQVQTTELRTGQRTVSFVVEQHKKANSIVQNAGKHIQATNKLDVLLNWLRGE